MRKPYWMSKLEEYKLCPPEMASVKYSEYRDAFEKHHRDEHRLNSQLIAVSRKLQDLQRRRYTDAEDTSRWGATTKRYDPDIKRLKREIVLLQLEAYDKCFKISKRAQYILDEN